MTSRTITSTRSITCGGLLFLWAMFVATREASAFSSPSVPSPLAVGSTDSAATEKSTFSFEYTHLEVNGMLWEVPDENLSIVVDPIASELNFGIPWGYRASKRVVGEQETFDKILKANPSHCLLSQGLDDHTHLATLTKLVDLLPDLKFIVAPSAYNKVNPIVDNKSRIQVLKPGQSISLQEGKRVNLQATEGALVGPPWQARENGWLLRVNNKHSVYMEPHGDVPNRVLRNIPAADIVILPVKEQSLPAQVPKVGQFKLVYGGERALEIARSLKAKVVIPLANGELDTTGPLAELVQSSGSYDEFLKLVEKDNRIKFRAPPIDVKLSTPGIPLQVLIE